MKKTAACSAVVFPLFAKNNGEGGQKVPPPLLLNAQTHTSKTNTRAKDDGTIVFVTYKAQTFGIDVFFFQEM